MRCNWRLTCVIVLLCLCAGCDSRPKTVGLQGEASFDGHAIERGTIDFVPVDGTAGGSAGAPIAKGRYEISAKAGLFPDGTYLVRIIGLRKTGKTAMAPNRLMPKGSLLVELDENFIPPIYNIDTTLKVRVADLPDKNKVNFQLGKTSVAIPR